MDTDEYEISLSRELDVCKGAIRTLQKRLQKMEARYGIGTGKFLEEYRDGRFPRESKDAQEWIGFYKALGHWEKRQEEFEEIFRRMRI
jgi:hypothetical protein